MAAHNRRGRGEGSIYLEHDHHTCPPANPDTGERPKHTCRGRYRGAIVIAGKRIKVTARTKAATLRKMDELRTSLQAGTLPDAATTGQWLDYWLNHVVAHDPKVRPRTLQGYRSYVRVWLKPQLGDVPLQQLRPEHLRALHAAMRDKGRSETTIRQAHVILSSALKAAVSDRRLRDNVARLMSPPRAADSHHAYLDAEQARKVLDAATNAEVQARLAVALHGGLRQSEALALTWDDIDHEAGLITINGGIHWLNGQWMSAPPKSAASKRQVPMTAALSATLKAWQAQAGDGPYIFGGDQPRHPRADRGMWSDALAAAGVDHVPLHGARATAAIVMRQHGIDRRVIADILGHSAVVNETHYQHSSPAERRSGVDVWQGLTQFPSLS